MEQQKSITIPAYTKLKVIPLCLSANVFDGQVTVYCTTESPSCVIAFPAFLVKGAELEVNGQQVPLVNEKTNTLNFGIKKDDTASLNIDVMNFNMESRLREEVQSKLLSALKLKRKLPIEDVEMVGDWSLRIATPKNASVCSRPFFFTMNRASKTVRIALTPEQIEELRNIPLENIFVYIEGNYVAEVPEDIFKAKISTLGRIAYGILSELSSTPNGTADYIAVGQGGSIHSFPTGEDDIRSSLKIELSKVIDVLEKVEWAEPMIKSLFQAIPKIISEFQPNEANKDKVVNFLLDNTVKVSASVNELKLLGKYLMEDNEEKRLSDIEESLETGKSLEISKEVSLGEMGAKGRNESAEERKEHARQINDTLKKYAKVVHEMAEGRVASIAAIDVKRVQSFAQNGNFGGLMKFENFKTINVKITMGPFTLMDSTDISYNVGFIIPYAGNESPSRNWLFCDGRPLKSSDYPQLFKVIGKTYGSGDLAGNDFNLPDLRCRTIVCSGEVPGGTSRKIGDRFGAESTSLTVAQLPSHDHGGVTKKGNPLDLRVVDPLNDGGQVSIYPTHVTGWRGGRNEDITGTLNYPLVEHTHNIDKEGGSEPISLSQPSIVIQFLIKAF